MKRVFLLAETRTDYANVLTHFKEGFVLDPELKLIKLDNATVWPLIQYEGEEEKPKPEMKHGDYEDVTVVKDVTHGEVADLVKQGYVVHTIYQKNVVLIKRKEVTEKETK